MSTPLPYPSSFIFEITNQCNLNCLYCYNVWKNASDYVTKDATTNDLLKVFGNLIHSIKVKHITLTGGEPLLRHDLFDIVKFLKCHGIAINIISNGTLITEKVINKLKGYISIYELPLLSSKHEIHDKLTGYTGAFDLVTSAIADLKLAGERVVVVFVATRLNLATWRETIELAFALGVDGIMFNRFNPGGKGFQNLELLQCSPDELQQALDVGEELSSELDFPISCSIAMPPCLIKIDKYKKLTFGFCGAGTEKAYYTIDSHGNVRPCNHSQTILGNILETDFSTILNSQKLAEFLVGRPEFCHGCAVEMECLGACKAAGEVCYGSIYELEPFVRTYINQARKPSSF